MSQLLQFLSVAAPIFSLICGTLLILIATILNIFIITSPKGTYSAALPLSSGIFTLVGYASIYLGVYLLLYQLLI